VNEFSSHLPSFPISGLGMSYPIKLWFIPQNVTWTNIALIIVEAIASLNPDFALRN